MYVTPQIIGQHLMPVVTFVYEGHWIVGLVCEAPDGQWLHKELRVEDRMNTPVPHEELIHTLKPYLTPPEMLKGGKQ